MVSFKNLFLHHRYITAANDIAKHFQKSNNRIEWEGEHLTNLSMVRAV